MSRSSSFCFCIRSKDILTGKKRTLYHVPYSYLANFGTLLKGTNGIAVNKATIWITRTCGED